MNETSKQVLERLQWSGSRAKEEEQQKAEAKPAPTKHLYKTFMMVDTIPFFTGVTNRSSARHQVKLFTQYLMTHGLASEDHQAAGLFATFLDGAAETWFDSQPQEVQTSWEQLQHAFLNHFEGRGGAEGTKEARYACFTVSAVSRLTRSIRC